MSASYSSSGAGRGDPDAEPKTKKQRLAAGDAANSRGEPENEEISYQKAAALVFGGELYSKLLGYGGQEAILHFRGDRTWRKAMDELPADELKSLKLPVVRQPNDAELFLLRGLLTKPLEASSTLPNTKLGWTLSDIGRRALAASPLASNKMLQNLVRSGCDEDALTTIACRRDISSSVIDEFIASDCSPVVFHEIAENPASSGEVLSALLVRLPESDLKKYRIIYTLESIGRHNNTNRFDLRFLSRYRSHSVRNAVATNPKAVMLGLIQDLSTDRGGYVREGCAENRSAPQSILARLSTDKCTRVRQAVASNPSSSKELLAMMASSESEEAVLWSLAENKSISVNEVFSISNVKHRKILARFGMQPNVLMELVGMDNGEYDAELASNERTPADTLESLAMSDNVVIRSFVASNKNIPLPTIDLLMQENGLRRNIARNPSTPLNILEALATDEDDGVRMSVMENSASPEKLLVKMLTDPANSNADFEELYSNEKLSLSCLAEAVDRRLERNERLTDDLREVICVHDNPNRFEDSKDALPRGTAVALSKCDDNDLREYSAQFPNLPVMDILRLLEDPDLNEVPGRLRCNPLLQVAVEKLSQLLSKDMVGSDSHFDDEEQWW